MFTLKKDAFRRGMMNEPAGHFLHTGILFSLHILCILQILKVFTNSATGKCFGEGCKYWPMVKISTPTLLKSSMVSKISVSVSPSSEHNTRFGAHATLFQS
jgi:hypothetical protein